jgi:hypothetical protein
MIGRSIKSILGLVLWSTLTIAVLGLTAAVITTNYLAISVALYLQRFDGQPLSEEQLIGRFFSAFANDATLAQLTGLGIACMIAIGLFMVVNQGFGCWDSFQAMRLRRAEGDSEQATAFGIDLREKLMVAALILAPLTLLMAYDVSLSRYRSCAQAYKLDDPDDTVNMIGWAQISKDDASFAIECIRIGSLGYVAGTFALCIILELTGRKTRQYFDRCAACFESLESQGMQLAEQPLLGYDTTGKPVYDSAAPLAYDADGNEIGGVPSSHEPAPPSSPAEAEQTVEPLFVVPPVRAAQREDREEAAHAATQETGTQSRPAPRTSAERELQAVVGTDEHISLHDAARDPDRYYVDMTNRAVWDRAYYDALHGVSSMLDEQAA